MTAFVDASAFVAIVRHEPEALALLADLKDDSHRITSGLALWEAVRAVAKGSGGDMEAAAAEVDLFRRDMGITIVPIAAEEAGEAMRAHSRYGKGTGHAAKLNMGDCFSYACARTNGARLLYKGDDFTQTDLA